MKNKLIKIAALFTALFSVTAFSGCDKPTYEGFTAPTQGDSTLKPIDSYYTERNYDNIKPTAEKTIQTFSSDNEICVIEKKKSYYDVTLNYEKGSNKEVGAAYAEAILKAFPEYPVFLEKYLFENAREAFGGAVNDYTALSERLNVLKRSLDENYQQEIEGFAGIISNGENGFKEDGSLSYEEAVFLHMVPDALRPTACSAVTVNGNITKSGHRMTARFLDWNLGSENQLAGVHCVTHFKNGNKSFISVGLLGMLDVLTAVNKDGVMIGEFDVGTNSNAEFVYDGKTCYSYGLRYAIENYSTAKDVGKYLINHCSSYTFSTNALITDDKDAFCAELCVNEKDGRPVLRDSNTLLHKGLEWDSKNCLGIVNSFAAEGNSDKLTSNPENLVRWNKFNKLFCHEDNITTERFKELLTCERIKDDDGKNSNIVNFRSSTMVHMVLYDYDSRTIQAILTGTEGTSDQLEFIDLGKI